MKHYTARATRSGKWWAITVDQVKGAHSQARRLDQVEANAREVIALMTDEPADSFDVEVVPEIPQEWQETLELYARLSEEASEFHRRAAEARETTVHRLVECGLTFRDVGAVMGISYQRVAQIDKSHEATEGHARSWSELVTEGLDRRQTHASNEDEAPVRQAADA
jgi:predicted RNase H-like HicB family nuclease